MNVQAYQDPICWTAASITRKLRGDGTNVSLAQSITALASEDNLEVDAACQCYVHAYLSLLTYYGVSITVMNIILPSSLGCFMPMQLHKTTTGLL